SFEEIVSKIDAPESVITHTRFSERAVEIQHADQAGPFTAPVGDRQDWALVRIEAVQNVMAILPDGLDDDQGRRGWNLAEHFHAALLAIDKAVLFGWIERVAALCFRAETADGGGDGLFGAFLRGPAFLIGREPQISARDENNGFCHCTHILSHASRGRGTAENV